MTMIRSDIRERFRRVVARAIERTDREPREHLASLRGGAKSGRAVLRNYQVVRQRKEAALTSVHHRVQDGAH